MAKFELMPAKGNVSINSSHLHPPGNPGIRLESDGNQILATGAKYFGELPCHGLLSSFYPISFLLSLTIFILSDMFLQSEFVGDICMQNIHVSM